MKTIHVHHQFHSVGHGTFFTGIVTDGDAAVFRWVYDCGSKRQTRVHKVINALADWEYWPADLEIDLLAISHFDDDHINGLESLLYKHRVKCLALPYIGFKTRLAHASSLTGDETASASTATFAIDPIGYLSSRSLLDRVDSILLVQGGDEGGASDRGQELPLSTGPDDFGGGQDRGIGLVVNQYPFDVGIGSSPSSPRVRVQAHNQPIAVAGLPMEFIFFNTAPPDGKVNRSKVPIAAVQKEVNEILRRYRLLDPLQRARRGWREQLKRCYTRHFGSSGTERNNISLCVMARPLSCTSPSSCGLFDAPGGDGDNVSDILIGEHPQALLLTGDLSLDGTVISAMQSHFRSWRWQQLAVTQIPHHGSRHSWAAGNAGLFPRSKFVQCIPTVSNRKLHPHASVIADLIGSTVFNANYEQSVVHSYHFEV